MKVKELIEELQKVSPDADIIKFDSCQDMNATIPIYITKFKLKCNFENTYSIVSDDFNYGTELDYIKNGSK